jgi:uncharacterized protein (DUF2236 family)
VIWQVIRNSALLLGGGRALLMQAAHPLALAGFVEHSDYTAGPFQRLKRTMESVWTGVYGSPEEAERVGQRVQAIHARVKGVVPRDFGPVPAGTPYAASDPQLLLWVHATLVDTSLICYRTFVGDLSGERAELFYQDMSAMARLFGTPDSVIPPTLAEFDSYMATMLASETICVPPEAREIARVVTAPVPRALRPGWWPVNLITAGLLPEHLREQYGFRWTRAHQRSYSTAVKMIRSGLLPVLPEAARALPMARFAERRLAEAASA